MTVFLAANVSVFEPLLAWECLYICHDLRSKNYKWKKSYNKKVAIDIQLTFNLEINLQKARFLPKYDPVLSHFCVLFEPLLGWECA